MDRRVQVKEVGPGAAQREAREKLPRAAGRSTPCWCGGWIAGGRSVTDLLSTLQELEHLGVGFVSLTEAQSVRRISQQQADLDHLLARQQQRTAPEYHQWLTPQEFGARFGASHEDLGKLKNWLESRGFQVRSVLNNASVIDFAATAGKIRDEFHTARCIRGNNGH
ncbi:MAG TPA: protease pro-enzyme activation domain-containing protein [Terriglobales bacterium]|nr:protease pro-enzyme activation domain-containing protein [Terriglobales bacterium]